MSHVTDYKANKRGSQEDSLVCGRPFGLRLGYRHPDTKGEEYSFPSKGFGSRIGVARVLEVKQALIGGAFLVYVPIGGETMLANSYTSDMSAGVMVCESMLNIEGQKVFVCSNNGEMVSENVHDPSGVLSAINVAVRMLGLIMR